MNRYFLIFGIVLAAVVVILGIGYLLLPSPTTIAPGGQGVTVPNTSYNVPVSMGTQEAVQEAFQTEIAPYDDDNTKLDQTILVGEWALQAWSGDNKGGEALLKYDAARGDWVLVNGGGGAWSVDGLVDFGVPRSVAEELLKDRPY